MESRSDLYDGGEQTCRGADADLSGYVCKA